MDQSAEQPDEDAEQHADRLSDDCRRDGAGSRHDPKRQRRSAALHAQRPRREDHERRDLLVVFLKFACPDVVEIEQIVQEINQGARGRPQRARRHARRQCGDRERGKDHAGKSRERGRFRIGQQHAEKDQSAALRVVVMVPDVVWRKPVIFQDFEIVIKIVRVIIAAAAGKKSAPQQHPRGGDGDQNRADLRWRCAALPQARETIGECAAAGDGDTAEMSRRGDENHQAQYDHHRLVVQAERHPGSASRRARCRRRCRSRARRARQETVRRAAPAW